MRETSRLIFKTEIAELQYENAELKRKYAGCQEQNRVLTRRIANMHVDKSLLSSQLTLAKAALFKVRKQQRERWQI